MFYYHLLRCALSTACFSFVCVFLFLPDSLHFSLLYWLSLLWGFKTFVLGFESSSITIQRYWGSSTSTHWRSLDLYFLHPLSHHHCQQATIKCLLCAWLCAKDLVGSTPSHTWESVSVFSHFTDNETKAHTLTHLPQMTHLKSDESA